MARMDTGPAQRQPYSPRRHVPRRHRTLQGKVRCRAIKCRNRVPASLVQIGRLPAARKAPPDSRRTLGAHNERFNWGFPLDATPLGGHHLTSGPSTPTTCAPSVLAVIGRVLAPRAVPPHVGTRTGSICVRVALRRGGPCGAPEPLGAPCEPGTCPLCTPSGGGRITGCMATAHDHEDPAPSTGRARAGAHCTPAHASRCAGGGGGGGVPRLCPTPRHVRHEREAWAGQVRVGRVAHGYHPRPRGSRVAPSAPMCGTTSRSMRGARRGGPASTPTGTHGTRARRAHTPREGGSAVQPVAPTLGPQGERVTHAPVRRGARDARGRELSFLEFCPPFW